jgi:murein DD-endopeptidase MepM/ murein hydrolase activator NlpD
VRKVLFLVLVATVSGCSALRPRPISDGEVIYTVVKGDSLERVAKRSGISVEELALHNDVPKSAPIHVGQILKIPSVGPLTMDAPSSTFKGDAQTKMVSITRVKPYVGKFSFPVQGARFTSPFGYRWKRFHEGADFAAPIGTPIYAAHSGTVVFTSEGHGKYGKIVVLKGEGLITVYGHNNRNIASVGDLVEKGEHIANVGETGKTSGPHLHFETRVQDEAGRYVAVDPYIFFVRMAPS